MNQAKTGTTKQPKPGWLSFLRGNKRKFKSNTQSTNIAAAVEFLLNVSNRKTICFVVSDFHDTNYLKVLQSANRKHDVIAVMVTDPRELEIPDAGLIHLTDAETGQTVVVDSSSATVRKQFQQKSKQRIERIERELRSSKIDFVQIDCSRSIVEPLVQFFRMREQRRRR